MVHNALEIQAACTDELDSLSNGAEFRGEDEDGEIEVGDEALGGAGEL